MRSVMVSATFTLRDSVLRMMPRGMDHLPDGWRTFVQNESLRDDRGKVVSLQRMDQRRWRVSAAPGTKVQLTYTVRIEHDQSATEWFPGPREAAYARDWGIFAIGRALFILPSLEMSNTLVDFIVPVSWRVASALPPIPGAVLSFRADTRRDLTDALFFAGEYLDLRLQQGTLTFDFAIAPSFKSSLPLFEHATHTALAAFRDVFGVDPAKPQYLVVVNTEPEQTPGFGGAFLSGFSMTFPFVPDRNNMGLWAFTLTHETFHLWNAYTIGRASQDEEWFLEGGADYYTARTLARSGVASRRMALGMMSQALNQYRRAAGRVSLAGAGAAESKSGVLLYKGGWSVLAMLDLEIRRMTNDQKTLDDVMRALVRQLSGGAGGYRNADILHAVNAASGSDFTDFFVRYVTGTEVLNPEPYLAAAGLSLEGTTIVVRADATPAQLARVTAWIGTE